RSAPPERFAAMVDELSDEVAGHPREVLAQLKALVREGEDLPLPAALERELEVFLDHVEGPVAQAGLEAFAARRRVGQTADRSASSNSTSSGSNRSSTGSRRWPAGQRKPASTGCGRPRRRRSRSPPSASPPEARSG